MAEVRAENGVTGPLFLGKDTHALSEPAFTSALEVLVANNVKVVIQEANGYTPTPGISHAILRGCLPELTLALTWCKKNLREPATARDLV